jgi:hypothetical protein
MSIGALFNKLGLDSGLSREGDSERTIIFLWPRRMTFRGSSKGYAYSEKEVSPLFDSLKQNPIEREKRPKHGVAYKRIKDHWYLSYDW